MSRSVSSVNQVVNVSLLCYLFNLDNDVADHRGVFDVIDHTNDGGVDDMDDIV